MYVIVSNLEIKQRLFFSERKSIDLCKGVTQSYDAIHLCIFTTSLPSLSAVGCKLRKSISTLKLTIIYYIVA